MGLWERDFCHPNQVREISPTLNSKFSLTSPPDSLSNVYAGIILFFLIWFLVTDEYIESCCTENYLKIFNENSHTRYSIHLLFLINDKFWELRVSSHLIILSINARFQSEGHKVQIKLLTQRLCVLQSLYQPKSLCKFKLMLYIVKQIYSGGIF